MDRNDAFIRYRLACEHLIRFRLSEYSKAKLDEVFRVMEQEEEYEKCANLLKLIHQNERLFDLIEAQ